MNSFLKGQEILIAKTAACHGNWSFKTVLGKEVGANTEKADHLASANTSKVSTFRLLQIECI